MLKRWVNPDPIGFIDGNNKYAFVANNPLKYIDILGLSKHHYYAKHDSFDDYFYHKRTEEDKKGADTNLLDDTHLWDRFKTSLRYDLDFLVDAADSLVQASSILQTGIGIIEIGTGIVGLGGSGALEVATLGGASVIAVPVAAGSIALIADGAVKVGIGVACFKKVNKDHNFQKKSSVNQIDKKIKKGQAPKSFVRAEHDYIPDTDHIHFKDGRAIYRNGKYKHGPYEKKLTNAEKQFLKENGFKLPREEL